MDLTLPVDGKEKSPKKGFFKRISSSFRSPFSPKTVEPPQQIDDFESTKSHLESDTEENNKAIEERVEAELQKDEVVAQPVTSQQQPALPFSSTPLTKNQNSYTTSLPLTQVEPASLPTHPASTQALPSASNPQTIASTQSLPPPNPPPVH
jgi:hypothetical protein